MDFNQVASQFGIPVAILIAVGLALWRIITWLGNTVIVPLTAAHISLVEETKHCGTRNTVALEKMTELTVAQTLAVTKIAESQGQISNLAQKTYDEVVKKVGG